MPAMNLVTVLAFGVKGHVPVDVKIDFGIGRIDFCLGTFEQPKIANLVVRFFEQVFLLRIRIQGFRHHEFQVFLQVRKEFLFNAFRRFGTRRKKQSENQEGQNLFHV